MRKFTIKALTGIFSLAMLCGVTTLVNVDTASAAKKVTVTKVATSSPSGKTAYIAKGKKVKLSTVVTVTPNKKANKKVTYKTANKKIATVTSKGVVKGVKPGKTKITVVSKKNKKKKTTIKVVVKKAAVKKITLNAKSLNVSQGTNKALTAKVTPTKNVSKILAWTSSNTKVAKVSNKGVVTGVSKGSATITAKTTDGSGKKATCKVTVTYTVNLSKITILNAQTIAISLDNAQALSANNIIVKTKRYENGTYRGIIKVDRITTNDNKNYTLVLNNETRLSTGDYVQVSIPTLSGSSKVKEAKYKETICAYTDEEYARFTVGESDNVSFTFDDSYGYSTYTITGLPAGLTAEQKEDYLYVKGTPTKAGTYTATMKAIDELGNTLTKTIYFLVGSSNQIVGAGMPYYTLYSGTSMSAYGYAYFNGGGSDYRYEIVADPKNTGAYIDYSGSRYVEVYLPNINAAGTYPITVKAIDRTNENLTTQVTINITVAQGITVSGFVKDVAGNAIYDAYVRFTNKNYGNRYCTTASDYTNSDGSYTVTLAPGIYDVQAYNYGDTAASSATTYLYNQAFNASRTGYNFALGLYKVTLTSGNTNLDLDYGFYNSAGEFIGYGPYLYLKPGTYSLSSSAIEDESTVTTTGDWFNGMTKTYSTYKLCSTFTVKNVAVSANVTKVNSNIVNTYTYPAAKDTTDSVSLDTYYYLSDAYGYDEDTDDYEYFYAYKFVPNYTGEYQFSVNSSSAMRFYDTNGNELEPDGDGIYYLEAHTTYIVGNGTRVDSRFMIEEVE